MYNVYETITWDDVSYRELESFETLEEAEKRCEEYRLERKKEFVPTKSIPLDPVHYRVMSDLQYYNLMH